MDARRRRHREKRQPLCCHSRIGIGWAVGVKERRRKDDEDIKDEGEEDGGEDG